jgi:GNAT superfamily N-acetyltransferase
MLAIRPENFSHFADVVRTKSGNAIIVRFVEPSDELAVQTYFRNLSQASRYNRLLGAASELPRGELEKVLHVGENNQFAVIAETRSNGVSTVIGEARYVFDEGSGEFEFGLSVDDRSQGQGIGTALMSNLECRAAALGATRIVGETLRSNAQMIALARKSGFSFASTPDDWRLARFTKELHVAPQDIPCANWKQAALDALASVNAAA